MNILTVSTVFPYPPHDGTRIQIYQRVKHLGQTNHVTLLCILDVEPNGAALLEMRRYCEVHVIRRPAITFSASRFERIVNFVRSFVSGVPYYERDQYLTEADEWIRGGVEAGQFDLVEADGSAGIYLRSSMDTVKVWIMHSISNSNDRRRLRFEDNWIRRLTIRCYQLIAKRYERSVALGVHLTVALTPENIKELKELDRRISASNCLTNGVDGEGFPFEAPSSNPEGVCFVGKMDHYPNHDAALHFYRHIWPEVRRDHPSMKYRIVGSNPMSEVVDLGSDSSVEVTGYVADVRPFIRRAGVVVVPIRMGGGILNKVLEAMALGTPVVATRVAIQGLAVESGRHLFVCDSDYEFAAAVKRLFEDAHLRASISAAGRKYVETHHEWRPIVKRYEDVLRALVATRHSSALRADRTALLPRTRSDRSDASN